MSKVINLEDFKKSKKIEINIDGIKYTKEKRMKAKETLLIDDDKYVLDMLIEEDLKEM